MNILPSFTVTLIEVSYYFLIRVPRMYRYHSCDEFVPGGEVGDWVVALAVVGDEEQGQLEQLVRGLVLDDLLDPIYHLLELLADLGVEDLGEVVHVVELEGLGPR